MAIFSLKKYDSNTNEINTANTQTQDTSDTEQPLNKNEKTIYIDVDNTISDIVVKTLYDTFSKDNVEEVKDANNIQPDIQVVSTETINSDFVSAYRNLYTNNIFIFTNGKPFKTIAEEWFLTNTSNKTVLLTNNEFINFLKKL